MKSILLALALLTTGAHADQETDMTACDAMENDQPTLECSVYSRNAAEKLLGENFQSLLDRLKSQYADSKVQLSDITAKLNTAQQAWLKLRDADCVVEAFPAAPGSQAFTISQNSCMARMSDERSEFLESLALE